MIDELVLNAIMHERAYQEKKWPGHDHTLVEWILILEDLLSKLKHNWVIHPEDTQAASELRQLAATAVAAMEQLENTPIRSIEQFPEQREVAKAYRTTLVSGSEHGVCVQMIISEGGQIPDGIVYRNFDNQPVLYRRGNGNGSSVEYHCSHVV